MALGSMVRPRGGLIRPDGERTVLRPFRVSSPEDEGRPDGRTAAIIDRILAMDDEGMRRELGGVVAGFERRHYDVDAFLAGRFAELQASFDGRLVADGERARLVAAFFTEEYSIESAALFNPCAVPHPDQSGLAAGDLRLVVSLRGVGEGHVSSLVLQSGVWRADGGITLDARGPCAVGPTTTPPSADGSKRTAELDFPDVPMGDRVVFPFLPSQGLGIEDARFCRFEEADGEICYRGTFTAFDGHQTRQASVLTRDFRHLVARRLDGDLAYTKGAAWFPRTFDGRYAMLCRLDQESISLSLSDDPDEWRGGRVVVRPRFHWETVQMGNCGSPIEIEEGWLVLTHGVGSARTYSMGAALLDRDDPGRLLARTPEPLLRPADDLHGGYVPNVVYSCGGTVRGRELLLPYGVADNFAAFGVVDLDELLSAMR